MRDSASQVYVGLDIGTSAVRCVVGTFDEQQNGASPSIIGHGQAPNNGMRRGVVSHIDDVAEAVDYAVAEAERISGKQIRQATISINGSHLSGQNSHGVIAISGSGHVISDQDRARVEEASTIIQLPTNKEIIQAFTKNYTVDGQENIKNPVGMTGVRLEVDMHLVTAASPNVHSLELALEKAQIGITRKVVPSQAAAEAVLTRQQKEVGTAVVDIGSGTTNLIIFEDGEVQHVAVIPIGADHVTNDLAIGLKTDLDVAEMVKLRYGEFLKKATLKVANENGEHNFELDTIRMIVDSRLEELLEYVEKEFQRVKRARKLPGGVVLTGGGAKLPGIVELAKDKLQLASRIGKLQDVTGLADTVNDPQFYTAIGLMQLDVYFGGPANESTIQGASESAFSFARSLLNRFKN